MSLREDEKAAAEIDSARRGEQLRRLAATALLLNATLGADELIAVITAQAREAVGARRAVTTCAGLEPVVASEAGLAWSSNGSATEELVRRENRAVRGKQELAAPISGRDGRSLGVIQLSHKQDADFDEEDEAILVQFAQMASAALENARLHEEGRAERDRLAAIAQMAETVERAVSLDEIFQAALAALEPAAGTARSSILLFDAEGVMRFRAWRGLSDEYRAAVEGHSPWSRDTLDPQPLVVPDVAADAELQQFRELFAAEGIRALAFVPLVHGGALIGKFMLYHEEPHEFGATEIQLAQTIASHIASVTERKRAERELRDSRAELQIVLDGVADGITAQRADGTLVYANDAAARHLGFETGAELLSADLGAVVSAYELLDEERAPLPPDELPGRVALREGRPAERVVCYRQRGTGDERWSIVRATPVAAVGGRAQLAINIFHDVTERRRAEERVTFLGRASDVLAASLDIEQTLGDLARLVVPHLADYVVIDLVDDGDELRQVVTEHRVPELQAVLEEIRRRYPPAENPDHPANRALASGEPLLIAEADEGELRRAAVDEEHLGLYHRLKPASYLVVPLVARGRKLGTVSLGTSDSGRRYGPHEVALALDLAQRAAVAIDNARLHTAAAESFALLDTLLVSAPVGIGFWDRDLRYVRVNDALAEINRLPAEGHLGVPLRDVIPEMADALEPLYRRVIDTGEPIVHQESTDDEARTLGDRRHWLSSYYPVRTREGESIGVGAVIMEVTAQRRAEDRLRLLAEAGELFSSPLDRQRILERVVRLVVPRIADACNIYLTEGSRLLRVAHANRDPERERLMDAMPAVYESTDEPPAMWRRVVERGEALLASTLTEELVAGLERLGLDRDAFARVGSRSMMFVPFVSRGETLGLMTLGSCEPGRYTESDLELAFELARRASVAIDNSRLLDELTFRTTLLQLESEASLDGLLVVSTEGRILSFNRRFAEMWGMPGQVIDSGSDDAALAVALEQVADPEAFIERVHYLYEHPNEPAREEIPLRDGRVFDRYGAPIRGEDGTHYGYLWSFRDVTVEKQAEAAREAARARIQFLAEVSTVLASSLDYEETLGSVARLVVPAIADWCSISVLEEAEGIRTVAVAHADAAKTAWAEETGRRFPTDPDDEFGVAAVIRTGEAQLVPEVTDAMLEAALGDQPEFLEVVRELGVRSTIIVPLVARGRALGAISLVSSQSDRSFDAADVQLAEEVARRASAAIDRARLFHEVEARAQSAQALTFVADGVFLVDEEGVIRLWNPAAETVTGLASAQVVGRGLREAVPGWAVVEPLVPVARAPHEAVRAETVPLDFADRELWLSISGVAFPGGTVYAFRDLTEERAVERLKSDFVSTVSHELRTPLAAIYGAAMTLRRRDVVIDADQREAMLAVVGSESERLARIVNDILLASRLDSGLLDLSIESTDPVELTRSVLDAFGSAELPPGIALTLLAAPGLPPVAADADKVRQVLMNLVDNAVKYSPEGGTVEVAVQPVGHHMRFSVRDEGLGIPPAEHARIFEKFYRLDPNLTRGVGGTGLGLYICREIVRRMEGRIWVTSALGRGSTFSFELPLARP